MSSVTTAEMQMEQQPDRSGASLRTEDLLRLFSVLSHDLKSPIFSIDGFSELLLSDYQDRLDEDGKDFLQRIRSSVQQLKTVLDEMSQMVKLLSKPSQPVTVDMNELLEELRLKFAYAIEEGKVSFRIPDDVPPVKADPEKLRVALGELISNALSFTQKGESENQVEIEYEARDQQHCIVVRDNGIGIDPRYHNQIFEVGLKLDKSAGDGPGYGLYKARMIARSHGGEVEVESTPGEGSRFCFILPR